MKKKTLIIGGYRGIGKSIYETIKKRGDIVFCICRSKIKKKNFISADITKKEGINLIKNFFKKEKIDNLIFTQRYRGNDSEEEYNVILKDTNTIISEFKNIFGDLPYNKYVFIMHLYDNQYGGLEHLNSCHIVYDRWQFKDRNKYVKFISLVAHEYFHTFNVKRIRPKELGPFDYQAEHYSKMLWLAEGVTSYYDDKSLNS